MRLADKRREHDDDRRPALAEALTAARKHAAPIVTRLDRLSRDVHFISGLRKVPFIVAPKAR